ncbi:MAG TPA: PLP-dependent aminotransferase family protein [Solirubrobacterales bacterium]|nr:PLP-dependent aminotransferase family protein [Solirubrobacterales bacterium]
MERDGDVSLTDQIVSAFERAIAAGEVQAGEKLPPTRELAELAGVNHLTAARAYRRLAEHGLVTARVGAGTFVRGSGAASELRAPVVPPGSPGPTGTAWQHYALPEPITEYSDTVLTDMHRTAAGFDPDLIPLMAGYPPNEILPTERVGELAAEVMADLGPRALQYEMVEGAAELREQVAALVARDGLDEHPDRIVITSGAYQALTLVSRAVVRPGETVACESPSFAGVIAASRMAGANVLPVPTDDDGLDVDALEHLLARHEIRLVSLQPRLQNPTGRDLAPERRARLIELSRRHGFFILEDAVYSHLRFDGTDDGALRPLAPERVIFVQSLSKTVSPGLRVGWMIASGPVRERLVQQKRHDDMNSAPLTQQIAARYLAAGDYEPQLERAIAVHRRGLEAATAAVDSHLGGFVELVHEPLGGAHLWLALRDPLDERVLYREAVAAGVNFMPAGAAMPERPERTFLRISYSYLDPDRLREGVRRLGVAIRAARRAEAPRQALPLA